MDVSWLTAIVAVIVAVIALLQWITAREKLVLDLFDKRFSLYEELRSAMAEQIQHNRMSDQSYFKFGRAVSRAKFLFGPEVSQYLEVCLTDLGRVTIVDPKLTEEQRRLREDDVVARLDRLSNFYNDFDVLVFPYMQHTQKRLPIRAIFGGPPA